MMRKGICILTLWLTATGIFSPALRAQSVMRTVDEIMTQLKQGDQKQALKLVDKALKKDPDVAEYHFTRALCLSNYFVVAYQNHFLTDSLQCNEIEKEMQIALSSPQANWYWYMTYGELCCLCSRYEPGERAFEKALELADKQSDTLSIYLELVELERRTLNYEKSVYYSEEYLKVDPNNVTMLNNLGLVYLREKKFEEAKMQFLRILRINPNETSAYSNLGFTCLGTEEWDKAVEYFTRCLEIDPSNGYALSNRSFARMKMGDLKEAMKDINHSLEVFPSNSWAYKNRALIYLEMGKGDKACEDLLRAREMGYAKTYDGEVDDLIAEHCK